MLGTGNAAASEPDTSDVQRRLQTLREEISRAKQLYERRIEALERRIVELENAGRQHAATAPDETPGRGHRHQPEPSRVSWSMAGLSTLGGANVGARELEQLEAGTHDPRNTGITLQTLALAANARLNRHLDAVGSLVSHIEPDGENVVELEQAFIRGRGLPYGVSLLAGQHFLEFGEENQRHPPAWAFVDLPFMIPRLFGSDKLRSQGVRLIWAPPPPWRSRVYLGVYNPDGETATSFLFEEGEQVADHVLRSRDVDGPEDLLYLLKWSHRLLVTAAGRLDAGLSALFGPNASGRATRTQIYGLDLRWSAYPAPSDRQPGFDWRTELMARRYEAGDRDDPAREILRDYGLFSQAVWRLSRHWSAGLRAEFGTANADNSRDPLRSNRKRFSVNLGRALGGRIRLRLQYNRDWAEHLPKHTANSLWLQIAFRAGARAHE